MFKTQSSSQDEEGFFRPTQKIVQLKNSNDFTQNIHIITQDLDHHVNQIVSNSRPTDYKARIMKKFAKFIQYQPQIDSNQCQNQLEKLTKLQVLKNQEKSKRFYSLQQKYKNNQNYRQVYCKLIQKHEFDSYIFSLQKTTDYNQKEFFCPSKQQKSENNSTSQADIEFDSNFQSGNLFYAFQKLPRQSIPQFDLLIQNDTNTKGYNQWFYFSIENHKHQAIKVNIVNFTKKHLMFEDGVRPVCFSVKQNKWKFVGDTIQYKKSYVHRYVQVKDTSLSKNYYTLSFLMNLHYPDDKIYIALNFPYTYKKMINFLDNLIKETPKDTVIKRQNLCYSISNNMIPYLIISANEQSKMIQSFYKTADNKKKHVINLNQTSHFAQQNNQKNNINISPSRKKKNIIVLARQHPGQTVGSYVLEGFLRQLCLKPSQSTKKLLKHHNFYIVPMINVDGVIYGNFRTNLAGFDLNRQWIEPNRWLHPQIFFLKKLISTVPNIQFVLDFHGHSKKLNSFIYSCTNPPPTLPQVIHTPQKNLNVFRLYPYLFSKQCSLFSLKDCTYTMSQDKMRTARINTFKALNYHPYVFTLQTGFYGYSHGQSDWRYKISDFQKIGRGAFQSLKILFTNHKVTKKSLKQIQDKQYLFDKWTFQNKQDFGSQSNPSEDQLNQAQLEEKVMPSNIVNKNQNQLQERTKSSPRQQNIREKIIKKMINKIKQKEKSQTKIQIVIPERKIPDSNEKASPVTQYKKKSKSGRNNRISKIINTIGGSIDKKNVKNEEAQNYIQIKQARVQKPNFQSIQNKSERQQASFRSHKKQSIKTKKQQIKSASNLLGTGYYQKRGSFFQNNIFRQTSKTKIEVNNMRSQQMMVIPYAYPSTNLQSILSKLGPLSNLRQRTRTISLQVDQEQIKKSPVHKQRLYIIKQNKIVKVVNSINKQKNKNIYLNQTIQQQIINRTQTLKNCQKAMRDMTLDQQSIISQIKDKAKLDFKTQKQSLRPLITNSRNSSKNKITQIK